MTKWTKWASLMLLCALMLTCVTSASAAEKVDELAQLEITVEDAYAAGRWSYECKDYALAYRLLRQRPMPGKPNQ